MTVMMAVAALMSVPVAALMFMAVVVLGVMTMTGGVRVRVAHEVQGAPEIRLPHIDNSAKAAPASVWRPGTRTGLRQQSSRHWSQVAGARPLTAQGIAGVHQLAYAQ